MGFIYIRCRHYISLVTYFRKHMYSFFFLFSIQVLMLNCIQNERKKVICHSQQDAVTGLKRISSSLKFCSCSYVQRTLRLFFDGSYAGATLYPTRLSKVNTVIQLVTAVISIYAPTTSVPVVENFLVLSWYDKFHLLFSFINVSNHNEINNYFPRYVYSLCYLQY